MSCYKVSPMSCYKPVNYVPDPFGRGKRISLGGWPGKLRRRSPGKKGEERSRRGGEPKSHCCELGGRS